MLSTFIVAAALTNGTDVVRTIEAATKDGAIRAMLTRLNVIAPNVGVANMWAVVS